MNSNQQVVFKNENFQWLDIQAPSLEQLNQIAKNYGLHSTSVQDCLDSEHLPKYETIGDITFIILRVYDEASAVEADTIQELTKKIAIFIGQNFIITIHRKELKFMPELIQKWQNPVCQNKAPDCYILNDLIYASIGSMNSPVMQLQRRKDDYETKIFTGKKHPKLLQEGYFIKRKASAFKKLTKLTTDILLKISVRPNASLPSIQDMKEGLDRLYYYSDDIVENMSILTSLYISIESQKTNEASHRTNEIMRVLTIFSIFFMPLNFIAGIYGMNFEHMPELKTEYGYLSTLGMMAVLTILIFFWVRKKGWLKSRDIE